MFDLCIGGLIFYLVGFGIAFGHVELGGFFGTEGGFYAGAKFSTLEIYNPHPYTLWIF